MATSRLSRPISAFTRNFNAHERRLVVQVLQVRERFFQRGLGLRILLGPHFFLPGLFRQFLLGRLRLLGLHHHFRCRIRLCRRRRRHRLEPSDSGHATVRERYLHTALVGQDLGVSLAQGGHGRPQFLQDVDPGHARFHGLKQGGPREAKRHP